jgi:hypothetical protein
VGWCRSCVFLLLPRLLLRLTILLAADSNSCSTPLLLFTLDFLRKSPLDSLSPSRPYTTSLTFLPFSRRTTRLTPITERSSLFLLPRWQSTFPPESAFSLARLWLKSSSVDVERTGSGKHLRKYLCHHFLVKSREKNAGKGCGKVGGEAVRGL